MPLAETLDVTVRLPDHVVHRSFVSETVVLNLQTGKYHGVNQVGGRMLVALERAGTVAGALEMLVGEFDAPSERIEADLRAFCEDLASRGLIMLGDASR